MPLCCGVFIAFASLAAGGEDDGGKTAEEKGEAYVLTTDEGTTQTVKIEREKIADLRPPTPAPLALKEFELESYLAHRKTGGGGTEISMELVNSLDKHEIMPGRASHRFWVVGPPGGPVEVTMEDVEWHVKSNDTPTTGPFGLHSTTDWGRVPQSFTRTTVTEVDHFRQVGLFRVDVAIATPVNRISGGSQTGTAFISKLNYKVRIPSVPEGQGVNIRSEDPYLVDMLNKMVVNKEHVFLSARPPEGLDNEVRLAEWNEMLVRADGEGMLAMARLARGGVYTITSSTLREAGYRPEDIPVDRLRVLVGEQELPAHAIGVMNNRLLDQARLVFYVPDSWQDRQPYYPLWLMMAEPGVEPRRLEPSPQPGTREIMAEAKGWREIVIFKPEHYSHRHPPNGPFLRWGTAEVAHNSYSEHSFEARAVRNDEQVAMTLWLAGVHPTNPVDYAVFINEQEVFSGNLRGVRAHAEEIRFPASYLRNGTNSFAIYNREASDPSMAASFSFLASRMKVPVSTGGILPNQPMILDDDVLSSMTMVLRRLPDLEGDALMFDISKPHDPQLIPLLRRGQGDDSTYFATADFSARNPTIIVASQETFQRVNGLARVQPPRSFTERKPVDYLAIHHPDIAGQVPPLLNHRRSEYSVDHLSVYDIYNAFSFGEQSYQAIHSAIKHTYARREPKRLQKVVLIGEGAEYWWEHRLPSTGVSPNRIPVFGWADPTVTIHGDDSYSLIAGKGPLPDVELGRISVTNEEELRVVVEKIIDYELRPPSGKWRTKHLFVTDDEPEFDNVVNEIVEKTIHGAHVPRIFSLKNFPYEDYFRGIWRKRSTVMSDRMLEAWNEGALTITYMGHGGPNLWSSERILHIRDIDKMEDGGRHPFMLAGSCDTGWVDYPVEPVKSSLAEQLLRREGGGVIGGFIPIDGTSSYEHNFLLTAAFQGMFDKDIRDIGSISLYSKINYHLHRNNARVTNQYLLMGDPGVRLPAPMRTFPLEVQPKTLLTDAASQLKIEGKIDRMRWGMADVTLLDPSYQEVAVQRFRVVNGSFSGTIDLPGKLKEGTHNLVAVAVSDESAQQTSTHAPIEVLPTFVWMTWDSDQPLIDPIDAGTPVAITITVKNDSELPIPGATLELRNGKSGEVYANVPATLPPNGSFSHTVSFPLPPGVSSIEARLRAANQAAPDSPLPVAYASLPLRTKPAAPAFAEIDDSKLVLTPSQGGKGTRVTLPVHNLTESVLQTYALRLVALQGEEQMQVGLVQPLDTLPPGESALFTFTSTRPLDLTREELRVEFYQYRQGSGISMVHSRNLEVDVTRGPDLVVPEEDFVLENQKPRAGTTVFARFKVRNIGDEPAYQVRPVLYLHEPWIEKHKVPNSVPWADPQPLARLDPGEEVEFRLRWDPQGAQAGAFQLFATATSLTQELDLSDNSAAKRISLFETPNLLVVKDDVHVSHSLVQPYDRVRISIPIKNGATVDFLRDFRVTATAITTAGERERLFTRRFDSLLAGESATMQFDWFVREHQNQIEINVNEDREFLEGTYEDNIHALRFPYVVDSVLFERPSTAWNFDRFMNMAEAEGLNRLPGARFVLKERPNTRSQKLRFSKENLIEGELGADFAEDNLVGIRQGGSIAISQSETASPVKFRFKLDPAFRTNYYDLSMDHFARRSDFGSLSGVFNYRLQDDIDWTMEDRPHRNNGFLKRMEVKNNLLLFEVASAEVQAYNVIASITATPVMGIVTGPVTRSTFFPRGRAVIRHENTGSSRIDVEVRYGHGSNKELVWDDWQLISLEENLPQAPEGAGYFQWRAFLYGAEDGEPLFRGITFEVQPEDARQIALRNN